MLTLRGCSISFRGKGRKYKLNMRLHLHFCTMRPRLLHISFSPKKFATPQENP